MHEKDPLVTVTEVPLQLTLASPDKESEAEAEIVTAEEVKFVPSTGDETLTVGTVLSMLRVVVTKEVFPPASVTLPVIC